MSRRPWIALVDIVVVLGKKIHIVKDETVEGGTKLQSFLECNIHDDTFVESNVAYLKTNTRCIDDRRCHHYLFNDDDLISTFLSLQEWMEMFQE